jgi:hypothetical protein
MPQDLKLGSDDSLSEGWGRIGELGKESIDNATRLDDIYSGLEHVTGAGTGATIHWGTDGQLTVTEVRNRADKAAGIPSSNVTPGVVDQPHPLWDELRNVRITIENHKLSGLSPLFDAVTLSAAIIRTLTDDGRTPASTRETDRIRVEKEAADSDRGHLKNAILMGIYNDPSIPKSPEVKRAEEAMAKANKAKITNEKVSNGNEPIMDEDLFGIPGPGPAYGYNSNGSGASGYHGKGGRPGGSESGD